MLNTCLVYRCTLHTEQKHKNLRQTVDDHKAHELTVEQNQSKSFVDNSTAAKKRNQNVNKMREVIKSSLITKRQQNLTE